MGVVARVHGYDCRWRAAVGEHSDQDQISVVDPVKRRVWFGVEALGSEHGDDARGHGEVGC